MQRAGSAAAFSILKDILPDLRSERPAFLILTGAGNNGGDGFVIASVLSEKFASGPIQIRSAVPTGKLRGDARLAFDAMPERLRDSVLFDLKPEDLTDPSLLVIDCLLGTGITGSPREPVRSWIAMINASLRPVVSIDVPSGLNCDDGSASGGAVLATETLTFAAPKIGLLTGEGPRFCGRLRVLDIGIPPDLIERCHEMPDAADAGCIRDLYYREDSDTYKQKRGRVLILGGSSDYPSAPFLSAEAALRAGAGIVTVAVPASVQPVCTVPKSLIVRRIPDEECGVFCRASVPAVKALLQTVDAFAIGPGMTRSENCMDFLSDLLEMPDLPRMVADADVLNCFAARPALMTRLPAGSVLTPHAGEMQRLLKAF